MDVIDDAELLLGTADAAFGTRVVTRTVPPPPNLFDATPEAIHRGDKLYRVHSNAHMVNEFNPSLG